MGQRRGWRRRAGMERDGATGTDGGAATGRPAVPPNLPTRHTPEAAPAAKASPAAGGLAAAARLAASVLLGEPPDPMVAHVDPAIFSPARFAID